MYPAWGSVEGDKGRGTCLWRYKCVNMSGVYSIVFDRSIWYPIPVEQHMFQALRSNKCEDIYLFSGAHPLQRCRAAGKEAGSLDFSATCDRVSVFLLLLWYPTFILCWSDPKTWGLLGYITKHLQRNTEGLSISYVLANSHQVSCGEICMEW